VRKIKPEEERASNYEYKVEFFNPLTMKEESCILMNRLYGLDM
jgi:hypothetical protein